MHREIPLPDRFSEEERDAIEYMRYKSTNLLARRNLSDIGPSMLRSMKKGRLINVWIACSVRKSCVTKSWRQFLVTCSRSSAAEAKHSNCSVVPLPWNG